MADTVICQGEINRDKPGGLTDGQRREVRLSRFTDLMTSPVGKARVALADEGSYFVATNPTPGTGVAGIAATGAFSDAESLLYLRNTNTTGSGVRVYLDYLRLQTTAAGTNGTDMRYVSKIDAGDRYTSGGSSITPVNANMDSSESPSVSCYFGALVTTSASSAARLVGNGLIRNVITVVGDQYVFDFGSGVQAPAAHAVAGTAIANLVIPHAPVVLGPGDGFVLSLHATAQTGASSFEFELGFWER